MRRIVVATSFSVLALAACSPKEAEPSAAQSALTTVAAPVPQLSAEPAPPAPDTRIAALNLMCGGESFRVAFEDTRAVVVNSDGSNTELAKLPAGPSSEPGVDTFTDGKLTFTRRVGQGMPTIIKFAHGRMAFQDCAIAQN